MNHLFELFLREKQYINNIAPKTISFYRCSYNAFVRAGMNETTKVALNECIVKLRQNGLSVGSTSDYIKGINSFLIWLAENNHIEPVKLKLLKQKKVILPSFSEQDLKKLIEFRPKNKGQEKLKVLILCLIDSGCRINELLPLTKDRLDFDNLLIRVTTA